MEIEDAISELFLATKEVQKAQRNFDNATGEFFEFANIELSRAKERQRTAYLKVRKLKGV